MGKSAFALDLVRRNKETASLFCSMEMEHSELALRGMCSEAKVDGSLAQAGNLKQSDYSKLWAAAERLNKSKLWIDDRAGQSIGQLYATARKLKRQQNLGLLVVDYLQLIEGTGNEYEVVGNASKMFKRIAKELHIPVVVLSQLNRQLENRDEKRPRMSDLRGSGQIEQDADVIIFPYRPAVYCECMGVSDCAHDHKRDAEIIVAKHRGGKIGMAKAQYIGEHTTFIDEPRTADRRVY
jgi:replicative DNA helicase